MNVWEWLKDKDLSLDWGDYNFGKVKGWIAAVYLGTSTGVAAYFPHLGKWVSGVISKVVGM